MPDQFLRLHDMHEEEPVAARSDGCFVKEDVEHGLGWIGVDRVGDLVVVDLDERAIRTTTPEVVGRCLVDAIGRAEGKARRRRDEEYAPRRKARGARR